MWFNMAHAAEQVHSYAPNMLHLTKSLTLESQLLYEFTLRCVSCSTSLHMLSFLFFIFALENVTRECGNTAECCFY